MIAFPNSKPVQVVPYKTCWSQEFNAIAATLSGLLGETVLRIDHIGSTSVPGLAAKDIIDIQITIADLDHADEFIRRMVRSGYRVRGDIKLDEFVGCREWQKHQLRKRYFREADGERRVHFHVRQAGNLNQRYALLFRDYLRANATVRQCYEIIKYRLAKLFPEQIEGYLYIKDPVMDLIFTGAETWAELTAWQPETENVLNG